MSPTSAGQSPPTPVERRERRPTGTLLFLAALFALPIGTCGGIGASKASDVGRDVAAVDAADLAAVEDGAYVTFTAPLRHVATDELPLDDRSVAVATGTSVYAVDGAPATYVAAEKGALEAGPSVGVTGRVCSADTQLVCSVASGGLRLFLRADERRTGRVTNVVIAGATPRENLVEAAIGLGVAGVLMLAFAAVAALILRGRQRPFVFLERVLPVRDGLEPAAIAARLGPAFRPAAMTADALVVLTGAPASRAQLVGAFRPDDYPQRVEIWLGAGAGGYRQREARVRVSEIFAQPAGPPPQLMPSVGVALETTFQRVLAALNA
jgi:hypothetical protein